MKETMKNDKPLNRLKILFADDEAALQELMSLELPRMGHEVTVCPDGPTAVAALELNTYDCIIVDLDMPGMNGIQVIGKCKELAPDTDAVVLTGKSSFDSAIAALRFGAFDYLTKPCKLVDLKALLHRVAAKREWVNKCRALKHQLERLEGKTELVGSSRAMDQVRKLIQKVAPTGSTVLVLGETGTGKELVARAVHQQSLRAEKPFVAVNCGALPESLIESELFGHRKGSFTGADDHRVGLFEVAHGGTIFLDEIGELPKSMQAKLLRVLESGEIRRVGDNNAFVVDVRVVCATHRNLPEMVEAGDFREDLMYRINTFELHIPPLRERLDDIEDLASHLLRRFLPTLKAGDTCFTPEAVQLLEKHGWPGNVRELANVIEHASILCDKAPITPENLPQRLSGRIKPQLTRARIAGPISLRDLEMQAIHEALDRHNGNKPEAAEELGISLKTLYNKLNQTTALEKSA
ncbi:two component, sigma54 specific, transcriptional regulator, Fis family [Pirellula staleyi DSM 6068]|uniref:Two component, sigma54 specific, transcriptional regulator, Fis family n=1 Tax=Pirellula staleyi (strain ATCC 27377 / DSM 6068 / ICPB 4128) TaxID=530564 RepID=D2R3E8_PIRSD|nr:sigma-54 dependent transcriptional regulator [Pirellula staleyi]ADB15179.1 two component, sigma54 specific, transcriptional regulator, Fis family [Pirellula staleyi DSM 6068]